MDGPTLADRIALGAIPLHEALRIAKQIAEALEAAHEQGIIHRDLKPANIKLRPDMGGTRMRHSVSLLAAALACAACDAPQDETRANAAGSDTPAVAAAPQRDVSGVKGCELVRGEEVVQIAGASKLSLAPTAYPGGCMYVVEMADGTGESYQFRYDGTGIDRAMIEHFTPEEKMSRVEGPWDEGRIGPQPLGGGTRFVAVRGDLGIEVTGDRPEIMLEIAKLAAARAP